MKARVPSALILLILLSTLSGCAGAASPRAAETSIGADGSAGQPVEARKIVTTAELVLSVDEPEACVREIEALTKTGGGFVAQSSKREQSLWMQCRVPAGRLAQVMERISALGSIERRSVSSSDVTERYRDLATRLKNNKALRDRLQQLLKRAKSVSDVLAIEKELTRVQSEVETMQGQLDGLKSRVGLSTLSLNLRPRRILGPIGYLGYGLWWVAKKLFLIV